MKIVCAWCEKIIGFKEQENKRDDRVSHGICDDCFKEKIEPHLKKMEAQNDPHNLVYKGPSHRVYKCFNCGHMYRLPNTEGGGF